MQGRLVEWNPSNPRRFAASGLKLEYFDISSRDDGNRQAKVIGVREISQITSIQWCPPHFVGGQELMAYGCVNSVIGLVEWGGSQHQTAGVVASKVKETIINPAAKIRKPVTGLSWNQFTPNQLAASFDKQKGDYCGVVWDVTTGQETAKL